MNLFSKIIRICDFFVCRKSLEWEDFQCWEVILLVVPQKCWENDLQELCSESKFIWLTG